MSKHDNQLMPIAPNIPGESFHIGNKCFLCGRANQALFTVAEIHYNYTAMNYCMDRKWFNIDYFPTSNEIRRFIWTITDGNDFIINHAKNKVHFTPFKIADSLWSRLQWFRVYLEVRDLLKDIELE
jgi:hypothetical protein